MERKMAAPLLATKLHIPPIRPELVSRPRLTERLNEGTTRKLTLVSAPAGFGKTTLLSEWIHRRGGVTPPLQAAWLSLDKEDSDPARFWAYFIAALQTVQADVGKSILAAFQSPQPPPIEVVLTALINEIAAIPNHFALVLDDYHLIEAQPIHSALAFLLDHLPPQMHLIIAGRADPPLPLARLRGRGQLTELREDDLRFTPDEATAFLNQVMGLSLSAQNAAALEARTEGWIVGLQLAALSMQGRHDVEQFVESFTGSHRYILDYLIEEVFQQQAADVQDFLLKTSILDHLTAPLCDAIVEQDGILPYDAQAMLERLDQANLFIIPLDHERQWYRYHRLFADLLRHRLDMVCGSKHVALLHARASQWYEANGFPADAVHHALTGHDWERAATLISDASGSFMSRGEVTTLVGWIQALPDEVVRARPQLCLECSWPLILTGRLDAAESYLAQAEQAACGEQGRTTQEDAAFLGEIVAAQAYIARTRGDARRTIELSQRALTLLPQDNLSSRSIVALNLGLAHWHRGHLAEAEQALTEAERAALQSGNSHVRLMAFGLLGPIQAAQGKLHQAAILCRQAIQLGEGSPAMALTHLEFGALLYEWNDLEAAADHLRRGIELTHRSGNLELQTGGYRMLALLKQAQGDASAALAALQEAHQLARDHDVTPFVHARNAACHVQIALAQDDVATATHWAEQVTEDADAFPFYPFLRLTPARLLLAQNQKAAAAEQLEALYEKAVVSGWQFGVVEVRALQALAAPTPAAALTFLTDALALAQPEGYVRTFVDKGEPMAALLREAASQGIAPDHVSKLLAAFSVWECGGMEVAPSHPHTQPLIEPLSDRELEVLQLLADGQTNHEIAQALHVSINTVKTHLKTIYGKLDVHSRREATAQAKKLGLVA
jgi:LuxR family maltose regulon positive regulatory protein